MGQQQGESVQSQRTPDAAVLQRTPIFSFIILTCSLAVSEFAVMFVLPLLPASSAWLHNLMDAALMILLAYPVLHLLVLRPLRKHITERQIAEADLRRHHEQLEQTVAERTSELAAKNRQLENEIQERRLAERALQESEEFTRSIVDSSRDCIKVLDLEGRLRYMSPGGQELLNVTDITRFIGMSYEDFWGPCEKDAVRDAIAAAQNGQEGRFTGYCPTLSGVPKWWDVVVNPIRSTEGQVSRLLVISRDITARREVEMALQQAHDELENRVEERTADLAGAVRQLQEQIHVRKQTEFALRQSEERYRSLFEAAPVGIALTTYQGNILEINSCLCTMLRFTREEALKAEASDIYYDVQTRSRILEKVMSIGTASDVETVLKCKTGATIVALLTMQQVAIGDKAALLTIVSDITQRKEAEKLARATSSLLSLFVTHPVQQCYLDSVAQLLTESCGCEAAAIRLRGPGDSLPFASSFGFSEEFIARERSVRLSGAACACMRPIIGQAQPAALGEGCGSDYFTCNDTSLANLDLGPTDRDSAAVACVRAGYQSIALFVLRIGRDILGAIQLGDKKPNAFPPGTIRFVQSVAPLIAEALRRFRAEDALHESERRFRSMFENHHATKLLVDRESGAIVNANPAAADFFGSSLERLQSLTVEDIQIPLKRLGQAAEQQESFETTIRLPGQRVRAVEVYASEMLEGSQRLVFLIIHDVTERKRLERQILEISENEQVRLGRDLHDALGQHLTATAFMAKALAMKLAGASHDAADDANHVVECVNKAITSTRQIAKGLCPVDLVKNGLSSALNRYAATVKDLFGVQCRFRAEAPLPVLDEAGVNHCYRIVQEAVTNAVRHGRCSLIDILLTDSKEGLKLVISDDGRGLADGFEHTGGMGLHTMEFRARALGARLTVGPGPERGVRVTCLFSKQQSETQNEANQLEPTSTG